jgi:hypothetical protein
VRGGLPGGWHVVTHKVSRLDVTVGLDGLTLDVRAGQSSYVGRLIRRPASLAVGERLHVRLVLPLEDRISPTEDCVDVLADVTALSGQAGLLQTPWVPGLTLTMQVFRLSRGYEDLPLVPHTPPPVGDGPLGVLPPLAALSSLPRKAEPLPEEDPTGVMGNLAEMPLQDVLQGLEMTRRTARVDLRGSDGTQGVLFVDKGVITDAQAGDVAGEDAFFALMLLTRGRFRIRFGREAPRITVDKPAAYLLLEAVRRQDELGRNAPAPVVVELPPIPDGARFGHFFAEARGTSSTTLPPAPAPRSVTLASQLPGEGMLDALHHSNPFWGDSVSFPPG